MKTLTIWNIILLLFYFFYVYNVQNAECSGIKVPEPYITTLHNKGKLTSEISAL